NRLLIHGMNCSSAITPLLLGFPVALPVTAPGAYSSVSAVPLVLKTPTEPPQRVGVIAELQFMPWINTRFSLQYVAYQKFNGGTSDYDGAGRSASANNTVYALVWLMF